MSARPIIFSGPMIRAIIAGRKSQTRRVAKPRGRVSLLDGTWSDSYVLDPGNRDWLLRDCPYGAPGDLLWVRESWRLWESSASSSIDGEPLDPDVLRGSLKGMDEEFLRSRPIEYCADSEDEGPWRPSIHMPRWASRITLRLTDVRVERLQAISESDATAEGAQPVVVPPDGGSGPYTEGFRELWDSINAGRGYGWKENPWVWALEFSVIQGNVDEVMRGLAP